MEGKEAAGFEKQPTNQPNQPTNTKTSSGTTKEERDIVRHFKISPTIIGQAKLFLLPHMPDGPASTSCPRRSLPFKYIQEFSFDFTLALLLSGFSHYLVRNFSFDSWCIQSKLAMMRWKLLLNDSRAELLCHTVSKWMKHKTLCTTGKLCITRHQLLVAESPLVCEGDFTH